MGGVPTRPGYMYTLIISVSEIKAIIFGARVGKSKNSTPHWGRDGRRGAGVFRGAVREWHSVHPFYWVRSVVKPPPHPHPSPHILCVWCVCVCVCQVTIKSVVARESMLPISERFDETGAWSKRVPSTGIDATTSEGINATDPALVFPLPPVYRPPSISPSASTTLLLHSLVQVQVQFANYKIPISVSLALSQALTRPKSHTDTRCGTGLRDGTGPTQGGHRPEKHVTKS
jgi:hypothetical protein